MPITKNIKNYGEQSFQSSAFREFAATLAWHEDI